MQVEESLTSEQAKCREVVRARCTPLEKELARARSRETETSKEVSALKVQNAGLSGQVARATELERDLLAANVQYQNCQKDLAKLSEDLKEKLLALERGGEALADLKAQLVKAQA